MNHVIPQKIKFIRLVGLCAVVVSVVTAPQEARCAAAIDAQRQAEQRRQAEQQAVQKQAYQEALRQQMFQKQLHDQRNQQMMREYERQLSQKQKVMYQEAVKREMAQQQLAAASVPAGLQENSGVLVSSGGRKLGNPDEVVDIYDLWEEFMHGSEAWVMIMDEGPKQMTVQKYIDYFQQKGVHIRKPAHHYVGIIDSMAKGSPEMLKQPFEKIMQIVAIMEYDFDNGTDRDVLARQVLGEKFYQQNKQRLGR